MNRVQSWLDLQETVAEVEESFDNARTPLYRFLVQSTDSTMFAARLARAHIFDSVKEIAQLFKESLTEHDALRLALQRGLRLCETFRSPHTYVENTILIGVKPKLLILQSILKHENNGTKIPNFYTSTDPEFGEEIFAGVSKKQLAAENHTRLLRISEKMEGHPVENFMKVRQRFLDSLVVSI